ncbi:MAG: type II toxin-antitoxin system RelE/ParE family toxin [Lentisphaeraceae bacterium]|nr:type II toxin-antitoxin system RelE/ParE family toxin [Lentisphaeraceae bacterium]
MIVGFNCKETEKIYRGERSSKFAQDIQLRAYIKLLRLDAAVTFSDLKNVDPAHFKKLSGYENKYAVRVNRQYRIRFDVVENKIESVELDSVELGDFH